MSLNKEILTISSGRMPNSMSKPHHFFQNPVFVDLTEPAWPALSETWTDTLSLVKNEKVNQLTGQVSTPEGILVCESYAE